MSSDLRAPDKRSVITEHYARLSSSYDDFLYYSRDFVRCLTENMIERLRLEEDDVLIDLGGGTGMYSSDILEQVPLRHPVTVVDPIEEMLAKASDHPGLKCVPMDALSFSEQPGSYNKVLMKEAVHHVDDRDRLFRNLFERLPPKGIFLLVHVPPKIDYPLFRAALERSMTWHADTDDLVERLERAGFAVSRGFVEYRHRMPKEKYFAMVAARYMSLLSSFDDDELEAGLAEMSETYAEKSVLEFTDHFDCLTADKR